MLSDTAESEFEQQQLNDNNHTYSLPPFANAKNKSLSLEIRRKESNLTSLNSVFDDNAARADTMRAHMKNVQQEYVHTQALYDAKSRQIETEDHLKLLAEREAGRLENEIKRKSEEDENTQTQVCQSFFIFTQLEICSSPWFKATYTKRASKSKICAPNSSSARKSWRNGPGYRLKKKMTLWLC